MIAEIDAAVVTLAVGVGGAIGTVVTGLIAAVAPIRNAATKAMQAALEEQRIQIDRAEQRIQTIAADQMECERERAADRASATAAQTRNEQRIRALESELERLRDIGGDGTA